MRKLTKAIIAVLCIVLCMSIFFACDPVEEPAHEHNYSELKSNSTEHWYECPDDGEIKPDSKVAHADTDNDGKCDVCQYVMHVHSYAEAWSKDATNHWKECACGDKSEVAVHVDANSDGKCDVCEHSMNYAIAIVDKSVTELYITKTLTLTATSTPQDASIAWSSSNEDVATVENGVVTAIGAGKTTITVSFADVSDSIEITVKNTIVNTAINADNFDLSGVYQDDAVVKSNGKQNSFVVFNGEAGKYYVASATVKVTDPDGGDTWSRVGISHYNGTDSYYGLQLSPGPSFNARKTVTMIIKNGEVQWGTVTDRSQVWSQHDLASINFDEVQLTAVRQGNAFYAYINGELYYADEYVEGFDGDTLPILNLGSTTAEFSKLSVAYGEEAVSAYLKDADDAKFYGSNDKTIINANGSIQFIGASDSTCSTNAKDHGAKYIGTQAVLVANDESKVEFDLTIDYFGSRDALAALAVTINRYDSNVAEARSLVIGQYKAGWTGWNSNGDLNGGIGSGGKEYSNGEARLEVGETYHVVFTRLMYSDGQDTQLKITDKDGNVLLEDAHGWHDGYTGRAVVSFLSRDLDCTISNIAISRVIHEHNYSELKHNDTEHWYECSKDGEIKPDSKEAHVDVDVDGKCDVCEHSMNYAIAIADKSVTELYITKTLTLTATSTPQDAKVVWGSSDQEVATIDEYGVITALKAGKTTITVSFADVSDTIEITVKNPIVNTSINADNFDLSGVYQDDAVVKSNDKQNSFVVFNGDAGKYYVASATVKVTDPDDGDTWSRVGISHYNGTDSYYGLQLSPGPSFNARKIVTMIIKDGGVQWGAITDRSQVWSQHNLGAIDFDKVQLTAVRQGNAFYAYINGELYWADEYVEGFNGDTLPILNLGSTTAEFSKLSVAYGESAVSEYLATADKAMFYGSNDKTIINANGSIQFIGASDESCALNAKDHGAKYIGTQAVLDANVASTIEFDLTIDKFGSRDALPALAVTINHYDSAAAEARSLVIGQYKAGWTGWNSNGNLNDGIGDGGKEYSNGDARLEESETYHVVFTRLMYSDGQDTQLKITDKDGNVLLEYAHGWHDGYTGRAVVSFLSRDLDCTISNIVISSVNA